MIREILGAGPSRCRYGTAKKRSAVAALAVVAVLVPASPVAARSTECDATGWHRFVTRPDLRVPDVAVHTSRAGTAAGYLFLSSLSRCRSLTTDEKGFPEIVDANGQPVWAPSHHHGIDFQPQTYRGHPVLTWWEGGAWTIMDGSYQVIARVRPGNGLGAANIHDMVITPQNTALILIYKDPQGPGDGFAANTIQEVDIGTGRVLFQWNGLDHIGPSESYIPDTGHGEYLLINSLSLDGDGNIIASVLYTRTIYKIDRRTGRIIWRLGGKKSDFTMRRGASFGGQHDAVRQPDGTITMYDNGSTPADAARGLQLSLDLKSKAAWVVRSYPYPGAGWPDAALGSMQVSPIGSVLISWARSGRFTEYSKSGEPLFDASYVGREMEAYRVLRAPWRGMPVEPPAVAGRAAGQGMTVYASWNGATEVATWRVLAGAAPGSLSVVRDCPKSGFETAIPVKQRTKYVAVQGLDRTGTVLGTSRIGEIR